MQRLWMTRRLAYEVTHVATLTQNGSAIKCQTPWALSDVMVRPSLRQRESEAIYCYGGRESFIPGLPTTHPTARHRLDYMLVYSTGLGKDNCSFADIDHSNVWVGTKKSQRHHDGLLLPRQR